MMDRCASCSSRRCIRPPPPRTSASSCRGSNESSPPAGTRSSGSSSLAAAAASSGTHGWRCVPFVRPFLRRVVRGAAAVIAVSDWLRARLEQSVTQARGKTEVVNCGVDLDRFTSLERTGAPGPAFVCVGSLIERKNVVRLADAFGRLGEGRLTFVGDGPLRSQLEGREGVTVTGYVPHDAVPGHLAAADVLCQPSLVEPFGQAALEGMACGRSVVATRVGGPPSCTTSGGRRHGWRRFSPEPFEIGEPDLDERPHLLLDPRLARQLERLLVALARLLRRDSLLEAVVAGDEQALDLRAHLVSGRVHIRSLARQDHAGFPMQEGHMKP